MPKALVILTADKDARMGITELVRRHAELGIRRVDFDCYPHPRHDCGVLNEAHEFLRPLLHWDRALVLFDREGCGQENRSGEELESRVEGRLAANGWQDRASAVVFDPELESWIWDSALQVNRVLGWQRTSELHAWLKVRGFLAGTSSKPLRPKEAFREALRQQRKPASSGLFEELGRQFRVEGCTERSFVKFRRTLKDWFPPA